MARKLVVEVVLDAAAYGRQIQKAQTQTVGLTKTIEGTSRSTTVASGAFRSLGQSLVYASGGLVAFGGAEEILRSSINAARQAQVTQKQLAAQLATSGIAFDTVKGHIEEATVALSHLSGFNVDELEQSFTTLVRTTRNVNVALRINEIAADVARGRHIQLSAASVALAKAYGGQTTALKRLGIQVPATLKGMQALEYVSGRFAGQAAAGATSVDKFNASLHNLEVEAGTGLLPILDGVLSGLTGLVSGVESVNHALRGMHLGFLTHGLKDIKGPSGLNLLGIGGGGGKAGPKPFPDIGFRGADLTAGGPAAPKPVTADQRNTWFDALIGRKELRASLLTGAAAQLAAYKAIGAILTARIAATHDITRKLNLEDQVLQNAATIAGIQAGVAADLKQKQLDAAQKAKEAAQKIKDQIAAARQEKMGWLDFAVERAQATKTIKDDLAAYRAKEKFLQGLIKTEGRTLELVSELWRVRQQIKDLNKKNVDADPLAGLMQVSSARLASILAVGTGLGAAGRRQLGFNIAGAEIQPLHVHVNIDGREVGRAVTKDQARTGKRTSRQTSGQRG